jgi:beta-lactamase superfamily II metal-dependent hydrolase
MDIQRRHGMLKIHFLNVGKGNCTVIKLPSERLMVVDIDNSRINDDDDVLQCPIDFLNRTYPNESIFRFILTHPDMDHMSGLYDLDKERKIHNFWDTPHEKEMDLDRMQIGGYSRNDWLAYQKLRKASSEPKDLKLFQGGERLSYWKEDGIKVLGPSNEMVRKAIETEEFNHLSYVLKIVHEGVSILLGGDATKEAWRDILAYHGADELKANVFLAPHHGSPQNIEKDVFKHIDPQFVVVSDHRGHSYDYTYYNSLAKERVYSTKHFGNVHIEVSATKKKIYTEKGS